MGIYRKTHYTYDPFAYRVTDKVKRFRENKLKYLKQVEKLTRANTDEQREQESINRAKMVKERGPQKIALQPVQQTPEEREAARKLAQAKDDLRQYKPPPPKDPDYDIADWEFEQDGFGDSYERSFEDRRDDEIDKYAYKVWKEKRKAYLEGERVKREKIAEIERQTLRLPKRFDRLYEQGDTQEEKDEKVRESIRRDAAYRASKKKKPVGTTNNKKARQVALITDATREAVDESDVTLLKRAELSAARHRSYVMVQGIEKKEKWKPAKKRYGFLRTVLDHARPMDVVIEREGEAREKRRADFVKRREEYTKGLNWFQKWIVPRPLLEFFGAPPQPKPGYDPDAPVTEGEQEYYREWQIGSEDYIESDPFNTPDDDTIQQVANNPDVQRLLEKYEDNSYTDWYEFDGIFLSGVDDALTGLGSLFKKGIIPLSMENSIDMNAIINTGDKYLFRETLKKMVSLEKLDYYIRGFIAGDWGDE